MRQSKRVIEKQKKSEAKRHTKDTEGKGELLKNSDMATVRRAGARANT